LGAGIQFAAALVLLTLAGVWLDGKLPRLKPLFTIVGFLLGFLGATASLYYQIYGIKQDRKRK